MVFAIFYVLVSGITNRINHYTWICVGLVVGETFVLGIFQWQCPLTVIARRYSKSTKDNFDIFLPNWLAKHNKTIFGIIFTLACLLFLVRIL